MASIGFIKAETVKQKPVDDSQLGFGKLFTDYMFTMRYSGDKGWHDAKIEPYAPLSIDPATTFIHYGQAIFEGLKAYRCPDGEIRLFRPKDNFSRMSDSAERLCMPRLDEALALKGLHELIKVEKDWIPSAEGTSLYIRPTMIATDTFLGVHPSDTYLFFIILSPVGAYYATGLAPIKIYIEDNYVRAVRGGVGFTKAAANYAISLYAGNIAEQKGYSQVLWLDGIEHKYIEEVGAMNMFFVIGGKLITPQLNGSILPGITRRSVLALAQELGYSVEERQISIDEVYESAQKGTLDEAFGAGTAAVISPVGELNWGGKIIAINEGKIGPIAQRLYDTLTALQYGKSEDTFGWTSVVE
jgi:branched-chain amino acid aminotransferase